MKKTKDRFLTWREARQKRLDAYAERTATQWTPLERKRATDVSEWGQESRHPRTRSLERVPFGGAGGGEAFSLGGRETAGALTGDLLGGECLGRSGKGARGQHRTSGMSRDSNGAGECKETVFVFKLHIKYE